jgi:hypothetical protein
MLSSNLLQNKVSAGQLGAFGQSLRTFVGEFQICPPRAAFDQYGRNASPQSIDTQTCPGGFPSLARIEVENSLRPFISPLYFNLPIGISGGADTMIGYVNLNRPNAFGNIDVIPVPLTDNKDSFLGARNVDNVAPYVSDIGSTRYGNVMYVPDYGTYGLGEGGFKGRYGGMFEQPKEQFRYRNTCPQGYQGPGCM